MRALGALTVLLFCGIQAHAGFLGQTVQLTYEFPSLGSVLDTRTFVVGPGVEAPNFLSSDPRANLDFSDTNIFITFNSSSTWTSIAFNGWHAFDVNATIPDITSVTINGVTNMSGLDASRITFDANNIWVNWNGLPFDTSTVVSLDVGFADTAAPEPSTFVLPAIGLVMMGVGRWRKLFVR